MIAVVWVLFFLTCLVLAFRKHPLFGLAVYFGTIYVHPPSRWWSALLPETRWAFISAVTLAFAIWLSRDKPQRRDHWLANTPAVLMSIYIVWMWVQMPWALDFESHVEGTIKYMKYMMAFWFVYRLSDTKEHLRWVLLLHVIGCALLGIFAFYTPRENGRLNGVGGPGIDDSNTLGMYLATGALLCAGLMVSAKGWRRWILLVPLALIGQGFVLANSRGSFIGLVAGGLVLSLCIAKAHRRGFWALALVGLMGFALAVDQTFVDRMFTIGDVTETSEEADMSARSRAVVADAQINMAMAYPHGAGYRGTVVLSPQFLDRQWLTIAPGQDEYEAGRASHNTFLTHLVEFGLPGATLFLLVVAWVFTRIPSLRRLSRRGGDPDYTTLGGAICAALAAIFVAGLATDYFMAEVQFWLLAALAAAMRLAVASQVPVQTAPDSDSAVIAATPAGGGGALQPVDASRKT